MKHFSTIYNQFLKQVPRAEFKACVEKYNGDHRVRTFSCWSQFGTMTYAQVSHKTSLRDVVTSFANKENYFYHFGIKKVSRSTLADANRQRDWRIYQDLFQKVFQRCHDLSPKHQFTFKNKLESFDATTIDLCLEMFPWAEFRRAKGAIKVHAKLDHSGQIPSFVNITDGKTHEIKVARTLELEAGSIYVFDRAMIDYKWLYKIDQHDAYFVTRAKDNMNYVVVKTPEHQLPPLSERARRQGIIKDQIIRIAGTNAHKIPIELRRVVYCDPETGKIYEFITNIFHLAAWTIARIYKARWEIELFFKWIKQHLKIKTFLGTTKNAVMTQVWIAMITFLILAYIKYKTQCQYSLSEIQRLIQANIFARMHLNQLLFPDLIDASNKQTTTAKDRLQLSILF